MQVNEDHRQEETGYWEHAIGGSLAKAGYCAPRQEAFPPQGNLSVFILRGNGCMEPEDVGSLESRPPTKEDFIIDLMKSACGIDYENASASINNITIDGVIIPFASIELLWKMKQPVREKDQLDLLFLREQLKKKSGF